jgi:hypothetical protein
MDFQTWKAQLITEIRTAAEWRAERARSDPDDPRIEQSQKALFDLAEKLEAMPDDHPKLNALFKEEGELSNLMRAAPGEPEKRYHDTKEDLLQAYGIEHPTFENPEQFIDLLRNRADETISEYRLRA